MKENLKIIMNDYITPHFTLKEMCQSSTALRLGIDNSPDDIVFANILSLCEVLEKIRDYYGKPIRVTSGYRCAELNKAIGGSETSAHCKGLAVDFTVLDISNINVCRELPKIYPHFSYDQIIYEFGREGWVHLGLADNPRGEILTAKKVDGKTVYLRGIVE